jgi:hypothetical protein
MDPDHPSFPPVEPQWAPWTVAGRPDPASDDATRIVHHALLTDPSLLTCFRRRFSQRGDWATQFEIELKIGLASVSG